MFIVMGALVRTGALDRLIKAPRRRRRNRTPNAPWRCCWGSWRIASAFMNNTPIVVVMIPVVVQIAGSPGACRRNT
jgi:Na+/H+ antiporter NhaD/arsenite permease-like protein